ncbi:MAG: thioredoxin-like domain-containing protein [Verrucomicrobiota bacterium]
MSHPIRVFLLLLTVTLTLEGRTWTDNQGRTMEAEIVELDGDEVVFEKPNRVRYNFPLASLSESDQSYILEQSRLGTIPKAPTPLTRYLESYMVVHDGAKVHRALENDIPKVDYIMLYFSAGWCPPCRKFTPSLTRFYRRNKDKHPNFEIIFVSSDESEEAMESYFVDYGMPWLALDYDRRKDGTVNAFSGDGIPCLVLLDREGNVIMHSYEDGQYKGPRRVMNKLAEILESQSSS